MRRSPFSRTLRSRRVISTPPKSSKRWLLGCVIGAALRAFRVLKLGGRDRIISLRDPCPVAQWQSIRLLTGGL